MLLPATWGLENGDGQIFSKRKRRQAISFERVRDDNPFRLERKVLPESYELVLRIDPNEEEFHGQVGITVTARESTGAFELNSVDLEITSSYLETASGQSPVAVSYRPENEIVELEPATPLAQGEQAHLSIGFTGRLRSDLSGLYRSVYVAPDGSKKNIATTQFESTGARKAFPCFDEPDMKATFNITLEVPEGLMAISNYPIVSREALGDGFERISFESTMKMSTYLLAFIVGDLVATEPVLADGVPVRVIHIPGREGLSDFALEVAAHAISYYHDYFGIAYPAPKLDLIAIPDFAFGAMENLGAVTFRETALLVNRDTAARVELERVCDVVNHEIAHMWFGDLVTMKWWNGIWLNEAFATYMEINATDKFRPQWRRWESFGIERLTALSIDSLPSTRPIEYPVVSPADAHDMFDALTYQKGAAVLKMAEQYLGEDTFRAGVRLYLNSHLYGNAETTDLWEALSRASGQPISEMMDTWIFQGGHPQISVDQLPDGIRLTQSPFRLLAREDDPIGSIGASWHVPVIARTLDNDERKLLLNQPETALTTSSWPVVVNAHGWGVYRVRYSQPLLVQLAERLHEMEVLERFDLLADAWALVLAENMPLTEAAILLRRLDQERNPNILQILTSALSMLDRIANDSEHVHVQEFAQEVLKPVMEDVGLNPVPDEDPQTALTRVVVFSALGNTAHDREVIEQARAWFREEMSGIGGPSGDLAQAVLSVVARHGEESDFAFILDRYRNPKDPQDERRHLLALAEFPQASLASRLLPLTLSEIRTQDAAFVVDRVLANPHTQEIALDFIFQHFDELLARLPEASLPYMTNSLSLLIGPQSHRRAQEVFRFFAEHRPPSGQRLLDQTLERLLVNLRFRERNAGSLSALANQG
jgi:puromycin-sensitive aminopeptidase